MLARIETKVWAAMAGASGGAAVASAALWGLGVFVWHADSSAVHAEAAVAAVPTPVAAVVGLAVTVLGTFIAGYNAPPSNHAGNNATGAPMDDSTAGHDAPAPLVADALPGVTE